MRDDQPEENMHQLLKSLDDNCVNNLLNNPQSHKMFVNEFESKIFLVNTLLKCSDDHITFITILDDFVYDNFERYLKCFESELKKLEPESPLVNGSINMNQDEIKECQKRFPTEKLENMQKKFEEVLGPLDVFSCGAVTGTDDFLNFMSKGAILKFKNITEELRSTEIEKLKEWLKDMTFKTADCMIKRFESDFKGKY
jgi:hypothetical protein